MTDGVMCTADQKSEPPQVPRSILKQPTAQSSTPTKQATNERNRETALYHANLIQQRKDVESLILSSTEALLELPSTPDADPARPSSSDAAFAKNALKSFQPSDYDALITERNINHQCGYVLCPKDNRTQNTKAKYRILREKGKGADALRFVKKESLEKWCSDDCGRRALYVKVQLNEEPAWERRGEINGDILLLDDTQDDLGGAETLIQSMQNLDIEHPEEDMINKLKSLAIERGENRAPSRSFGLAEVNIQETPGDGNVYAPSNALTDGGNNAFSVEGYNPRRSDHSFSPSNTTVDKDGGDIIPTI